MTTPFQPAEAVDVSSPPGPIGHRGTRASVLLELKRAGVATAASLAASLDCAINTVRHHLKELEAEDVVVHDRTHHGVGAPLHAYRLSPAGHALFPDRYADTLSHLLDHVVQLQGREASVALLQAHYAVLGDRICAETAELTREERGEHIARALNTEGFMATWQPAADGGVLTEHNCPHRVVAERFPEVCAHEEVFLARAFGATVQRQSRIAGGCGCCSYHITANAPVPESGS
jgi:DeoR family suf operon transcriptional repressor